MTIAMWKSDCFGFIIPSVLVQKGDGLIHHLRHSRKCRAMTYLLCFINLLGHFLRCLNSLDSGNVVVDARQAGSGIGINRLINMEICLSSADDNKFNGDEKLIQLGLHERS